MRNTPSIEVLDVVAASPAPAVVVDVASQRMVAVSIGAQHLLGVNEGSVLGSVVADYLDEEFAALFALISSGALDAYESRCTLKMGDGSARQLHGWVRRLVPAGRASYAILVLRQRNHEAALPPAAEDALPAMCGMTDARLVVSHVSADVERVLGYRPESILQRSFFELVDAGDIPLVLWALAQATTAATGTTVGVRARSANGDLVSCQLLIVSLRPSLTFGFALLPARDPIDAVVYGPDPRHALWRMTASIPKVGWQSSATRNLDPDLLSKLSTRELEIVSLLLQGDRVPAIARTLHLSQSTVRNHLSAVFRKLHVTSQQELIIKLRGVAT